MYQHIVQDNLNPMQHIELSTSERRTNTLSEKSLQAALDALQTDGYVCLSNAINTEHIDALNEKMQADIRSVEKERGIDDNYQGVRPPPFHPYLYKDILFNPFAIAVSHALFGDGCKLNTYGANTAFAGSKPQQVHADATQLWPDLKQATPCHALVVNVALVDVDETNGATIAWPGTHLDTRLYSGNRFPTDEMCATWPRAAGRVCTQRGDLVLRDLRVWHGGMPNKTKIHRPMLAMVHHTRWWNGGAVEFEKGAEEFLAHPQLKVEAIFVDKPIDYLFQGHSRPVKK